MITGKEMVDYIADYLENIRDRRVFPEVCSDLSYDQCFWHCVRSECSNYNNDNDRWDEHDQNPDCR